MEEVISQRLNEATAQILCGQVELDDAAPALGAPAHLPHRVPVRVYGSDFTGKVFVEETLATALSPEGAHVALAHSLISDDVITIKNLENGIEEEFRVVGPCQAIMKDLPEWGVERTRPESRIWGLNLQTGDGEKPQQLRIRCWACGDSLDAMLSSIEHSVMLTQGMISRPCVRCGEATRWKPHEPAEMLGA
jgi:hypothetical protein